ncbi:MAG: BatA and WFA domain-containing protein [Candidatus Marinimicrobia bacterium]|nr:BatA and WFA domain-containing protein [Candidatus Neomarinimicrobiota bacterium]
MSFVNPFFLYFLPLMAIPVIIHLFGRRRFQTVEFSSIRFLKQLENDVIRRLKLRQILLLILRTLLVLFVVLAFARPYQKNLTGDFSVRRGATVYLILDCSASMDRTCESRNLMEIARNDLQSAFSEIEFPVTVRLIDATQPTIIREIGFVKNATQLTHAIAGVSAKPLAAKLDVALQTASTDMEKHPEASVAVWIASDFQKSSWQTSNSATHPLQSFLEKPNARFLLIPVNREGYNIGISRIENPDQIVESGKSVMIRPVLTNWTPESVETPVSLFIEGERVGQSVVSILHRGSADISFEWISQSAGYLSGFAETPDDDLLLDNRRYFVMNIPDSIRILVVGQTSADARYFIKALEAKSGSSFDVRFTTESQLPAEDFQECDVLLISDIDRISESFREKLDRFLDDGGGLIVFPGEHCQLEDFNRAWSETFGLPKWKNTRKSSGDSYLKLGSLKSGHPVFSDLWQRKNRLENSPRFFVVPGFLTDENQTILAGFEDGTPFLIETIGQTGRILTFATTTNSSWTDFQLTGLFPTLIRRAALYAAGKNGQRTDYFCGDTVRFDVAGTQNAADLVVTTPTGKKIRPRKDQCPGFSFFDCITVGVYRVEFGGRRVFSFAANVPESECVGEFFDEQDFREIGDLLPSRIAVYAAKQDNKSAPMNLNREYAILFLVLAAIVAALETFIGRINRVNILKETNL